MVQERHQPASDCLRYFFLTSLLVITILIFLTGCGKGYPEKISPVQQFSQLQELFADPPADYRSAPLWDWNGRITREGITFQMEQFKQAGIGGVFVHPRPGLITGYLSDEWFELFDYTVQKGKELGMNVWIYDENSYPSGFAGGHVPAEMPESWNRGTGLSLEVQEILETGDAEYEVILKETSEGFTDVTSDFKAETGREGRYYLFSKTYAPTSYWYGGFRYVDLLAEGVTEKFLELTMTDGYALHNAADFGHTVKGVFTDEPNLEAAMERGSLMRWTPDLWAEFHKRYGYDLRLHLPSLVLETGNWKKVRHDYYKLLLNLFVERWAEPWYHYCEEQDLLWTGHYWEHGWPYPTHGFDEMAFYIWHQQPGVDMLGSVMDGAGMGRQFGNTRAVRELASAANQAGRNRTLSETYGGGGWEMDFLTYKQLADWQAVLGVNFVNQHLSYYTLRGVRKFDYPPSFSYHEPWWDDYRLLGDYLGRMSLAGSSGEQVNEILVLQPNTTAWMYFSREQHHPQIDTIQRRFKSFVWELERHHVEYDLGSEYVLEKLGSVERSDLIVGKRVYGLVILPSSMENIDSTTYVLLKQFIAGGGRIISLSPGIGYLDGDPSPAVQELLEGNPQQCLSYNDIADPGFLEWTSSEDFTIQESVAGQGELYHQRRQMEDGQLLMLVNSSAQDPANALIESRGRSVLFLDPVSGRISRVAAEQDGAMISFQLSLPPAGSALYFISGNRSSIPLIPSREGRGTTLEASGETEVKADQENLLVLSYLDLESGDLELKDTYFMDALLALFEQHRIETGNPWQHKIQYRQEYVALDTFPVGSGFTASYHFDIAKGINRQALSEIRAVVEGHELWDVYINDHYVEKQEGDFWMDRSFHYYPVGDHLEPGRNTLMIKANRMSIFAELMPVYLCGPFLLDPADKGFEITGGTLESPGSWKENGFPFYSGKVAYSRSYNIEDPERDFFLQLKDWNGTTAEIYVNGSKAGQVCWPPYELCIGHMMTAGENEVTVKVVGSLKNTFGHLFKTWDSWIKGPGDWNRAPGSSPPADQYTLIDYGLFSDFDLIMY